MDETYPIKAIILKREAYREADTRVVVYGREHGRLDLVARGTKKLKSKMAGHLEPITLSNIMVVRGRQFDYIGSAVCEDAYINIKNNLEKIESAGKAFNFFLGVIKEGIEDKVIFDLLLGYLEFLNGLAPSPLEGEGWGEVGLLADFFILKLMSRLGYKPELFDCVTCHQKIKPKGNKFNFSKGGLVCPDCLKLQGGSSEIAVSEDAIKVLRLVLNCDFRQLQKVKISGKLEAEIGSIIGSFQNYHS